MNNFLKYNEIIITYKKNQFKFLRKILEKMELKLPATTKAKDGDLISIYYISLPSNGKIRLNSIKKVIIWAMVKRQQVKKGKF